MRIALNIWDMNARTCTSGGEPNAEPIRKTFSLREIKIKISSRHKFKNYSHFRSGNNGEHNLNNSNAFE